MEKFNRRLQLKFFNSFSLHQKNFRELELVHCLGLEGSYFILYVENCRSLESVKLMFPINVIYRVGCKEKSIEKSYPCYLHFEKLSKFGISDLED